jgi:hypothetical protein
MGVPLRKDNLGVRPNEKVQESNFLVFGFTVISEKRMTLIHRVIVPDEQLPKEYAVLVTDRRSIFIRQEQTRSAFVLRGEMRYGTALVTDVVPKTLEDYEQASLDSMAADPANISIPHDVVLSVVLGRELPRFRARDFFVWLTMRRQGEIFQVYYLEMTHLESPNQKVQTRFYLVPLGAYFKPRRQLQTREKILKEYADGALQVYQNVMPPGIVSRGEGI